MLRNDPPEKPSTILCVDDREDALAVRVLLLQTLGYEALAARDYASAFDVLSHTPINLAILDYHLAGEEDGETLARRIRAQYPEIKLVMLSGTRMCLRASTSP